jgi:UDP-N-acetylmuramoyl-L-alanyl-D-glutamate--2,6-diaminopimelate ligase
MSMPAEIFTSGIALDELLRGLADAPAIVPDGISTDSRTLKKGDVFLACQGATSHGIEFLDQAIAADVAAVVWDSATAVDVDPRLIPIPAIPVEGLAGYIGTIANRWFDTPSRSVRIAAVTGTNGKTTVAYLIAKCLHLLDRKCGYIGTLGSGVDEITGAGGMTTPACVELNTFLAGFREHNVSHAAIEVSSHALEQKRVDGVYFDAAIFTNLSRDHIDYHGDMQAYGEVKARLFLDNDINNRIICIDTEFGMQLAARCSSNVVSVSTKPGRESNDMPFVAVRSAVTNAAGSKIALESSWGPAEIHLQLPGEFNVTNAAEVLALLLSWDIPLDEASAVLGQVSAPPGRMELVKPGQHDQLPAVYIDYSHTPASLDAALSALRSHCKGSLWCVFGCGGDRDRGKRPLMGKITMHLADHAIVTNDNPRSEAPAQIIADITKGMGTDAIVIEDRRAAIAHAVSAAGSDDIVLIAGKGHENYQIIGEQRDVFSDLEIAEANLLTRLHEVETGK